MVHRRTHKRRRTCRKQHGGGWGYSGIAINTSAGAPLENRASYDHCYDDMRVAPAISSNPTLWGGSRSHRSRKQRGSRTRRNQRGGGCNSCSGIVLAPRMNGGGAGLGGYSLTYDNSLGKTYSEVVKPSCGQAGGASIYENVAYPASYGYDTGSAYLSSSAHFLEHKADVSRCASGGARRRRSRKAK